MHFGMKLQTTVREKLVFLLRLVLLEICWQLELTYRYLFTNSDTKPLEFDKSLSSFVKSKGMGNVKIHQIFSNSTLTILSPTDTIYRTTYRQVTQQEEDIIRFACGKGSTSGNNQNQYIVPSNRRRNSFKIRRESSRRISSEFAYSELNKRKCASRTTLWIESR